MLRGITAGLWLFAYWIKSTKISWYQSRSRTYENVSAAINSYFPVLTEFRGNFKGQQVGIGAIAPSPQSKFECLPREFVSHTLKPYKEARERAKNA
jgi:hypothetical protein